MRRSLEELLLGLDGSLNISSAMEALMQGLMTDTVPRTWMAAMSTRYQEVYGLQRWVEVRLQRQAHP